VWPPRGLEGGVQQRPAPWEFAAHASGPVPGLRHPCPGPKRARNSQIRCVRKGVRRPTPKHVAEAESLPDPFFLELHLCFDLRSLDQGTELGVVFLGVVAHVSTVLLLLIDRRSSRCRFA
jgi:hypothetical protein